MNSNQKKFGVYVFLSTFSRNLIEVFIPVILYKNGFSLKEVIFYYLIVNLTSLIICYPFICFSKKFDNKILSIMGIAGFVSLQILLNYIIHSPIYLVSIAILFTIYRRGYWIARRFYSLNVIKGEKVSTTYSIISIINQIGVIVSAYFGSVVLDFVGLKILTISSIILFLISIIPLNMLKFKRENTQEKLNLINTMKKIPIRDVYLFGSYELLNVVKFLIPLYLFIYVKNTYHTIGIINLITNLAIIIFTYLFGKKLENSKTNYLGISIILVTLIYVFKTNTFGFILLVVSFIEGFFVKMYELCINSDFYELGKYFEYNNYNLAYEVMQNSFRSIITFILFLSSFSLKNMIYFTLFFIFIGASLTFRRKV